MLNFKYFFTFDSEKKKLLQLNSILSINVEKNSTKL